MGDQFDPLDVQGGKLETVFCCVKKWKKQSTRSIPLTVVRSRKQCDNFFIKWQNHKKLVNSIQFLGKCLEIVLSPTKIP